VFNVRITNNNDTEIENADLFIEYPNGAYSAFDSEEALPRTKTNIGKIGARQTINESVKAVLFGQQGTRMELNVALEFRFKGSGATLKKEDTYSIEITSSPVDVTLGVLNELTSGQEVEFINFTYQNSRLIKGQGRRGAVWQLRVTGCFSPKDGVRLLFR